MKDFSVDKLFGNMPSGNVGSYFIGKTVKQIGVKALMSPLTPKKQTNKKGNKRFVKVKSETLGHISPIMTY